MNEILEMFTSLLGELDLTQLTEIFSTIIEYFTTFLAYFM